MKREEVTPTEVSNGTGIKMGRSSQSYGGFEKKMIHVKSGASFAVTNHAANVLSRMLESKIRRK
jgi:hypothetical protein